VSSNLAAPTNYFNKLEENSTDWLPEAASATEMGAACRHEEPPKPANTLLQNPIIHIGYLIGGASRPSFDFAGKQ
jgi:hypothetical protein